jgi:NAD(P)-dependent dehydrogenase (short-subunit alcohol dehydrogenase family)
MGKLQGKVAVITGATSGMALAAAKRFVAEGHLGAPVAPDSSDSRALCGEPPSTTPNAPPGSTACVNKCYRAW